MVSYYSKTKSMIFIRKKMKDGVVSPGSMRILLRREAKQDVPYTTVRYWMKKIREDMSEDE